METPEQTVARFIQMRRSLREKTFDTLSQAYFDKLHKTIEAQHREARRMPISRLKELIEAAKAIPHEGFGEGFDAGEVLTLFEDEIKRRKFIAEWDARDVKGEKTVALADGSIYAVLVKGWNGQKGWSVHTPRNGLRMASGRTRKEAIANAERAIANHGAEKVARMIDEQDARPWIGKA